MTQSALTDPEKFSVFIRGCYDQNGKPIFPEKYSKEHLENLRKEKGSYEFSCQYLNKPIDPETAQFKLSDIRYFDVLPFNIQRFCAFDPAFSTKEKADYTAGVVIATDRNIPFNIYVDHYIREHLTASQVIDKIYEFRNEFLPEWIGIESNATQKVLYDFIYKDPRINQGIPIQEIKPDQDKFRRILKLQPFVENHRIFLREGMKELIEEMMMFPVGRNDDLLDALANCVKIAFEADKLIEKIKEDTFDAFDWTEEKMKTFQERLEEIRA